MGDPLRHKLAQLAEAAGKLRQASLLEKAAHAEHCIALQLELLGAMVDKISTLEKERQQ